MFRCVWVFIVPNGAVAEGHGQEPVPDRLPLLRFPHAVVRLLALNVRDPADRSGPREQKEHRQNRADRRQQPPEHERRPAARLPDPPDLPRALGHARELRRGRGAGGLALPQRRQGRVERAAAGFDEEDHQRFQGAQKPFANLSRGDHLRFALRDPVPPGRLQDCGDSRAARGHQVPHHAAPGVALRIRAPPHPRPQLQPVLPLRVHLPPQLRGHRRRPARLAQRQPQPELRQQPGQRCPKAERERKHHRQVRQTNCRRSQGLVFALQQCRLSLFQRQTPRHEEVQPGVHQRFRVDGPV